MGAMKMSEKVEYEISNTITPEEYLDMRTSVLLNARTKILALACISGFKTKKSVNPKLKFTLFRMVGKHSLPLSHSFDNPKLARCRSPVFNGFSILGFYELFLQEVEVELWIKYMCTEQLVYASAGSSYCIVADFNLTVWIIF